MTKEEILKVLNNVEFSITGLATNLMYKTGYGNWSESSLSFNELIYELANQTIEFKIKEKPVYVPYASNDWREFLGKNFTKKSLKTGMLVIDYDGYELISYGKKISYKDLLRDYVHEDGRPAGKLIEVQDDD